MKTRTATRRFCSLSAFGLLLLTIASGTSLASKWPGIIRQLERADRAVRKKQLPIAYNNYAMEFFNEKDDYKSAEKYLGKAIQIADMESNLKIYRPRMARVLYTHAASMFYDRKGNDHLHHEARRLAERATTYNKKLVQAHVLIGDIAYDNQDLQGAKVAWLRAKSYAPGDSDIADKLRQLDQEKSVEQSFKRESHAFFDVRYQKGIDSQSAVDLRRILEAARKEVGRDLRYFPQHKLVVLVYSQKGFQTVRSGRMSAWCIAYYDGKIRLPIPSSPAELAQLKPTLFHEYTHALTHDLSRGRCPRWLNEGLAEYEESKIRRPQIDLLRTAARMRRLIPLEELDAAFKGSDSSRAVLAYQQACSMVAWLDEKHGLGSIAHVFDRLTQGTSFEVAFRNEFEIDLAQFEIEWLDWLPTHLKK